VEFDLEAMREEGEPSDRALWLDCDALDTTGTNPLENLKKGRNKQANIGEGGVVLQQLGVQATSLSLGRRLRQKLFC